MSAAHLVVALLALWAFVVLVVVVAMAPLAVERTMKRRRVEDELRAASWQIHQQTAQAFAAMLVAARQERP